MQVFLVPFGDHLFSRVHVQAGQQFLHAIFLDFQKEFLFALVEEGGEEHHGNHQHQGQEGGVEGNGQSAGDSAQGRAHVGVELFSRLRRLDELRKLVDGKSDPQHRSDKPEDGNGPDEYLQDGIAGFQLLQVDLPLIVQQGIEPLLLGGATDKIEHPQHSPEDDGILEAPGLQFPQRLPKIGHYPVHVAGIDFLAQQSHDGRMVEVLPGPVLHPEPPELEQENEQGPKRHGHDHRGDPIVVLEERQQASLIEKGDGEHLVEERREDSPQEERLEEIKVVAPSPLRRIHGRWWCGSRL